MVWQTVPQNSGELVYSQAVALTVTAVKVTPKAMIKITAHLTGRFNPINHCLNRLINVPLLSLMNVFVQFPSILPECKYPKLLNEMAEQAFSITKINCLMIVR